MQNDQAEFLRQNQSLLNQNQSQGQITADSGVQLQETVEEPAQIQAEHVNMAKNIGRKGKIDEKRVAEFTSILQKYRDGKKMLDEKIKGNYEWWRQRHWPLLKIKQIAENVKSPEQASLEPEPTTAHLFNCIQNKHADFMDNIPELVFLPVSKDDEETCEILNKIIPVVNERCKFTKTYSGCVSDKLIPGTGIYYVGWNQSLYYGMGDIDIQQVDPLKIFWKPGISDIQQSPYTFLVEELPKSEVEELFPFLEIEATGNSLAITEHNKQEQDVEQDYVHLVHCYYKTNGKIHYCYFCSGQVIYASENDRRFKDTGYFLHGKHPFVFDVCYPIHDSPFGFSLLDVEKPTQELIDKYTQLTVKNVKDNSAGKKLYNRGSGINLQDLTDPNKEYVECNSVNENRVRHIEVKDITANMAGLINNKIQEMNETSGNRDFTQGGTVAGVTSASAIAALQESGSKGSRDLLKNTYEAIKEIGEMEIEIMRQRYQNTRFFRIAGTENEYDYVEFNNQSLLPKEISQPDGTSVLHTPIFDVKIKAQKQSPFSTAANNEQYLNFFKAGMFNPQLSDQALLCVELLEFEGKENLVRKLRENGTLLQTVQELQAQLQQSNNIIQALQNSPQGYVLVQQAIQATQGQPMQQMDMSTIKEGNPNSGIPNQTNSLGDNQKLHNWQAQATAESARNQAGAK